jgi:glycosyltransferase involved in cell wall biosynthesis
MVIVHLTASRLFGSVERQMLGLASSLPDAYRSVFVSFAERGLCGQFLAEVERQGFPALSLQNDTPQLAAACAEVTALLRRLKANVVCCHGYKANLLGLVASRRLKIPAVAVCHGWTGENLKVKAYEAVDRITLRKMDAVVCVSEAQAARIRRTGVALARILVVHDAVRVERFSNPDPRYRQLARDFLPGRPNRLILAAGRLSPEKGFSDLVDAAALVARSDPSIGFVLFGDGRLRGALSKQIAERGLEGTFHLAGFHSDLDKFLPHFDLTVLPSYTEGLPNIVLESLAAGVPVVATAVGGTPEIIENEINGYLVEPRRPDRLAAQIKRALQSEEQLRGMGRAGRQEMLSKFTFDAQAKAYQGLFERLLRRSTTRSTPKNGLSKWATNGHAPSSNGHSGATIVGNGSASRPCPGAREGNGATPRPVRVCFLIDRLGTAGTESQLLALIRVLDRSRVLPHLCLLDGLDAQSQALEPRDCPVIRLGVRSLHHPSTASKALRLARFLRARKIDVLQTYFPDSTYFGAAVGRLAGIRRILGTRLDLGYWMTPRHRFLSRTLGRLLDLTVVNCEACREALLDDNYPRRPPTALVENGVDFSLFERIPNAALRHSPGHVGMVANLRAVKAPTLLVEAAALLAQAHPNVKYEVAGEGELKSELEDLISKRGLAGRFRLLGRVIDIPEFLSTLDVAVLCSQSEGMPNALLEYMAAGRAIVATAVGGSVELIEDGVSGLLVPPGKPEALASAIGAILVDPELAVRLGSAARQRVRERYDQRKRARRFESLYGKVLQGRQGL